MALNIEFNATEAYKIIRHEANRWSIRNLTKTARLPAPFITMRVGSEREKEIVQVWCDKLRNGVKEEKYDSGHAKMSHSQRFAVCL